MSCEGRYSECPGGRSRNVATSSDGWLQRRAPVSPAPVSPAPASPIQSNIHEIEGDGDEIDPVIRDALVGGREGDSCVSSTPYDVTLTTREYGSADREVWAIRVKKSVMVRRGVSRKIRTNLVLPPPPHPYVTKITSPDPHWLSEIQVLTIKRGVLNTRRGGRVYVDVHNGSQQTICLRAGSVIGQLIREPYLEL